MILALLSCIGLTGCAPPSTAAVATKKTSTTPSSCWMVIEVRQAGSGKPLRAAVWVPQHEDDFETLTPPSEGAPSRFAGIGRTASGGFAVPFVPGDAHRLRVWAEGHEVQEVEVLLKKGENRVRVILSPATIEDDRVPERIRTEAFDVPSEGMRSGS